jgi:hypothetical protein
MRMDVHVGGREYSAMNDLVLHRAMNAHLAVLGVSIDGEPLTNVLVDLLIRQMGCTVNQTDSIYSDGIDRVFIVCWRTDSASKSRLYSINTHLSSVAQFPFND